LPVYAEVLSRLASAGATWVQLDEPCLALDRTTPERAAFERAYRFLAERAPKLKILVATYFAALDDNLPTALELPVAGLHLDAVRAAGGGPLGRAAPGVASRGRARRKGAVSRCDRWAEHLEGGSRGRAAPARGRSGAR